LKKNNLQIADSNLKISVRELVERVLKKGDLIGGFSSPKRALEGTFGHQAVQRQRGEAYRREVRVSRILPDDCLGISLEVRGRIDGVFKKDDLFTIEEIKTTYKLLEKLDPSEDSLHFAQVKIYAFMFADTYKLPKLNINLTYYQIKTRETQTFARLFEFDELNDFFHKTVNTYLKSIRELYKWKEIRNQSIRQLSFPYPSYRKGQETFMEEVSQAIMDGVNLFAQAPTGLGKTMSVLYPSILSLEQDSCSKIFYLTARTTTREAPEQALDELRKKDLRLKSIVITAKEKTCLQKEMICNPETCEYLFNYFGKINSAVRDIYSHDHFNRETIEACSREFKVCPFELSLDLSVLCDCIICDYNYFFDPRVQLARYDSEFRQPYVTLVDEAHNLVERSRGMYSATLKKRDFLGCKRVVDKKKFPELHNCLTSIDKHLLDLRKNGFENEKNETAFKETPEELIDYLVDFLEPTENLLTLKELLTFRDVLLELYYQVSFFLKISTLMKNSDAYSVIMNRSQSNLTIKLTCLDASKMIKKKTEKGLSTVYFSATLSPSDYFFDLLGGDQADRKVQLPSPFSKTNRCLCLVDNISTRYRDRASTYDLIAEYLSAYSQHKKGNYLVFFPSYSYLEEIYLRYQQLISGITLIKQESRMSESEREDFVAEFTEGRDQSLVGFVVMGGIFGESIDLPGDKLSGAAIIGVGLPQINLERNLIRHHYDQKTSSGFNYAYTYPGMNKVLQAAGRLIRSDTDKGSLLLIDDRFGNAHYKRLYPSDWSPLNIIRDRESLDNVLNTFWSDTHQ
jgi:DNA excision repair protein ERCC-2